jgi:hypothetical protein
MIAMRLGMTVQSAEDHTGSLIEVKTLARRLL